MDWQKAFWDLAIGGIGGVLATFTSFWRAREELKGQHSALYKDIDFLLSKHRNEAYQAKKGEQAATHEDIENVLKDLKLITEKAEAIKATIGMEAWTRQMVLGHKRDAYRTLFKLVHEHLEALKQLHAYREGVWSGARRRNLDLATVLPFPNEIEDKMRAYVDSHRNFSNELRESFLFLGEKGRAVLNECLHSAVFGRALGTLDGKRNYLDRTHSEQVEIQTNGAQEMNFIGKWMGNLIAVAREELGVDPKH